MANSDIPFGFRPIKHINGSEYNGQVNKYAIGASEAALFVGDLVYMNGTANAAGIPTVTRAPAGVTDSLLGAIVGFPAIRDDQGRTNHPASTAGTVLVADASDIIYEAQATTVAVTDIGNVADIVATAGSTATGNSAMEVNGATYGTGAQVQVLRVKQIDTVSGGTNEVGDNAIVEVRLLDPQLASTSGV